MEIKSSEDRQLQPDSVNKISPQSHSKITVVIPSYNHERYIENTLRSVINQTLEPTKLIVIDDGSKDDSLTIIERLLKDCPFDCELIAQENKGLCATLNHGLDLAEGDFFGYLGSDDIWLPDFLKERSEVLRKRPAAVLAFGHCFMIDSENNIVGHTKSWASYIDGDGGDLLINHSPPSSPTVLYRRQALAETRWNENIKLEDYDLYLRLSMLGEFAFDPQTLSAWRSHAHNTSKRDNFMLNEFLAASERYAAQADLSEAKLKQIQTNLRFNYARAAVGNEKRSKIVKELMTSFAGADSSGIFLKVLFKAFLPQFVHDYRAKRAAAGENKSYGSILEYL